MNKTYLLLMSLTLASLSSYASSSQTPAQSNDTGVSPMSSVGDICKTNSSHINSALPLIDFENPKLDYEKGFLPNGSLTCDVIPMNKRNVKFYNEIGIFQGFDYKVGFSGGFIHLSSSPNTAKWKITCKKDDMEDLVTCSMNKHGKVPLFIHLGADGETTSLGLVTETYPHTEVAVKVGSNAKIAATSMDGLLSRTEITEQMKTSEKLITSFYTWPSKLKKVETHSIKGFSTGLILMKRLHREAVFK